MHYRTTATIAPLPVEMVVLIVSVIDPPDHILLDVVGPLPERVLDSPLLPDRGPLLLEGLFPEVEPPHHVGVLLTHLGESCLESQGSKWLILPSYLSCLSCLTLASVNIVWLQGKLRMDLPWSCLAFKKPPAI